MNPLTLLTILIFFHSGLGDKYLDQSNTTQLPFYNVIIQRNPDSSIRDLMCSGALISYDTVLTVAHCFFNSTRDPVPKEKFAVMLGELGSTQANSRLIWIKDIIIHSEYTAGERLNDLAVVVLQEQIEVNAADVVPIGLATYSFPPGTKCILTTWLSFMQGWFLSETLLEIDVVIVESEKCFQNNSDTDIVNRTICIYGNETALDGTYFLSGAPLVCNNILAGLSSQTIRSTSKISIEMFTNTNYYWLWVSNNNNKANKFEFQILFIFVIIFNIQCVN